MEKKHKEGRSDVKKQGSRTPPPDQYILCIYIHICIYVCPVVEAHSRACPRCLVSLSFPCCAIARPILAHVLGVSFRRPFRVSLLGERERGRGGGKSRKSDSTGSTAAAGPPRMLIIANGEDRDTTELPLLQHDFQFSAPGPVCVCLLLQYLL